MTSIWTDVSAALARPFIQPFRGAIHEYAATLNLQGGYAVKGPFDIKTAPHLREPLEAIRDPAVRVVVIQAAVQTGKSLIADLVIPYWIEHDPGDILWLFEDDPKAKYYAETRAMPLIRSVPSIHRMLEDVDRDDKTKTRIRFSHCNIMLAGLNEGNVQSISYRYVVIDEAWMSRASGLIRQAKMRATQYPDTCKIIIIAQGGREDEDLEIEWKQTDQRVLEWACPFCGHRQSFELSRLRDDDFPKEQLRGTYSGLSWDQTAKSADIWDFHAVARTAHYRCHACDAKIEDRPEIRRQLSASYGYRAQNPTAARDHVGFTWPTEASTRLKFGDQAVKYLRAKIAWEELGYSLPLQEFTQKDRGRTWSDSLHEEARRAVAQESYDANADWPEERYRPMIIDCQRDLKSFWFQVFAVSLAGEIRELARGKAESWEELAKIQSDWKVKDQQVNVDCGYEMTRVLRECVKHGHVGWVNIGKKPRKQWLCWVGMKGSGSEMFLHENKATEKKEWRIYSERKFYDLTVGTGLRTPRAPWFEFSNLHCKDLLRARRDGDKGIPKMATLQEDASESDLRSYFSQMRSEKRIEKYDGKKKRAIWVPIKETRPNHYWDIGSMLMAFMARAGIMGQGGESE